MSKQPDVIRVFYCENCGKYELQFVDKLFCSTCGYKMIPRTYIEVIK
jgi:hypothetical protein